MTIPHAKLEALACQICEGRRGAGAYGRKHCKRAYWRKKALALHARVASDPAATALYRACGWQV